MTKKQLKPLYRAAYGQKWFDNEAAYARYKQGLPPAGAVAPKLELEPERRRVAPKPERRRVTVPKPAPRKRVPTPKPPSRTRVKTPRGAPAGVMLAKVWKGRDPTGWWMSEKLDGMRAYWTGWALFTRNGNPIAAPDWFTAPFPEGEALDGEIYMGRGRFQEVMSVARKATARDPRWDQVSYMAFDAPEVPGGCEKRFVVLEQIVNEACARWNRRGPCPLVYVKQTKCKSKADLIRFHAAIAKMRGEGGMIRAPDSPYHRKRTSDLLKVVVKEREEAKVVGYEPGKGKHVGRLGAYWLQWPKGGPQFKVGTGMTDWDRENPLRKGTLITIEFKGLTVAGKPREPSFIGARDYE